MKRGGGRIRLMLNRKLSMAREQWQPTTAEIARLKNALLDYTARKFPHQKCIQHGIRGAPGQKR